MQHRLGGAEDDDEIGLHETRRDADRRLLRLVDRDECRIGGVVDDDAGRGTSCAKSGVTSAVTSRWLARRARPQATRSVWPLVGIPSVSSALRHGCDHARTRIAGRALHGLRRRLDDDRRSRRAARERLQRLTGEREAERLEGRRLRIRPAARRGRPQHERVVGGARDDEPRAGEEWDALHVRDSAAYYGLRRAASQAEDAQMVDEERPRREARLLPAVAAAGVALLIAVGVIAYGAGHYGEQTKTVTSQVAGSTTPTSLSAGLAARSRPARTRSPSSPASSATGCRAAGGVDPAVPPLDTIKQSLTVAQLTHIIDHGLGDSADPKQPYMPVWGQVMSTTQVSNLVSYIRAGLPSVADTRPGARAGGTGRRGRRRGALHPLRLHQLPRPERPWRRREPALGGQGDPAALRPGLPRTTSRRKIADVIRSGSVIGRAPIVSMPHWGGILSRPADRAADRVPEDAQVRGRPGWAVLGNEARG